MSETYEVIDIRTVPIYSSQGGQTGVLIIKTIKTR